MRKGIVMFSIFIVFALFVLNGCAATVGSDGTQIMSELNNRIIETVLENDESGGTVEASDVTIDQTFYGSFSKPEVKEVLVVCRILNTPHTGGLGRRAIIILAVDSMDIVAYNEIPADEVWVDTLPMSNGQDRIIFSGKSTYQGISAQDVMYFCIQNGQWTEIPIEELEIFGENQFYFLTEDVMIVTSVNQLTGSSDITAILTWDQDEGKFAPEQSTGYPNVLSESEIIRFCGEFFNSETDIMNNMLLSSEYSTPCEINLFQLFYNGTGDEADQISEEELAMLTEIDSAAPYQDVVKITASEMDAFLQERLGIGLEDTQKVGLEDFYYLQEYDSYYVITGDTNYEHCTVLSGFWVSDDRLILEYIKESEEKRWYVTLQKVKDGYLFVSNVRID